MKTRKWFKIGLMFWWAGIIAVFGVVVMLLWNALIPGIFGLAAIGFWQALGLLILARILFGGFGRRKMFEGPDNPIREKWMKMSPEERKEFINKRREHFHGGPFGRQDFFRGGFDNDSDTRKDHE
jgi:hypothetical protein